MYCNKSSENKHDTVYINKYDKTYKYGDIIVISTTSDAIIKRIVGLPGDVIDFVRVDGVYKLERNGEIIDEDSYILINNSPLIPTYSQNGMDTAYNLRWINLKEEKPELFNEHGKLVVGDSQVFALGDNRKVSIDSTYHGPFEMSAIQGVVENIKYYKESSFGFYWDYVVQGDFLITLFNLF